MAQAGLIPDKKVSIPGTLSQVDSKVTLKSASKQSAVSSGKYMNALKYASAQNALLQALKKGVVQTNAQDIFTTNSSRNTSYREPLSLQKGIEAYDQLNLLFEQNSFNLNSTLDFYQKSPLSAYLGEN